MGSKIKVKDWNGHAVYGRRSRGAGAVLYLEDWHANVLLPSGVDVPDRLLRQVNGYVARRSWFDDEDAVALANGLGRISKFQSLKSEDAVTWSWFGTLALAGPATRAKAIAWLYERAGFPAPVTEAVEIDQWPRVYHPNKPKSRYGPEIDARIVDPGGLLTYVEAKWDAGLGSGTGAVTGQQDDQVVLRRDSILKDPKLTGDTRGLVLVVTEAPIDLELYGPTATRRSRAVDVRAVSWDDLAACPAHPQRAEFGRYLAWKRELGTLV